MILRQSIRILFPACINSGSRKCDRALADFGHTREINCTAMGYHHQQILYGGFAVRLMRFALLLAAFTAPALLAPSAARANIEYPWCAAYGGNMGGASNCGFTTWEQCMATVSGI